MDGPCAHCGGYDVSAGAGSFGCQRCGAATEYGTGNLVHGPTLTAGTTTTEGWPPVTEDERKPTKAKAK